MKFTEWNGQDLKGSWLFTTKIDGIQAHKENGVLVTKGGEKIHNLPKFTKKGEFFEIYCNSWNETMSIARSSKSKRRQIKNEEIFPLFPTIDKRLNLGLFPNPTSKLILEILQTVLDHGFEGLVLRKNDEFIKVKPVYTFDVTVTGIVESDKRKGMIRKLKTESGDVGVGFSIQQRKDFFKKSMIGKVIEVKCNGKTKNGKFLNPRFVRLRLDKTKKK